VYKGQLRTDSVLCLVSFADVIGPWSNLGQIRFTTGKGGGSLSGDVNSVPSGTEAKVTLIMTLAKRLLLPPDSCRNRKSNAMILAGSPPEQVP
jgi:hypothetical protein